jgi:hypothetical protein
MFIAALFTTSKLWKQPRCPTTDEWIKEMWYSYTMEFYSATKKNEILLFAGKWVEPESIILSKLVRLRMPKHSCSPSNVDYRPKPDHTLRESAHWRDREREGNQKLECT